MSVADKKVKKTKKSKAVVIWAIICAILLLVLGSANYLVSGKAGGPLVKKCLPSQGSYTALNSISRYLWNSHCVRVWL